ncbi:killer cell lectin-like receptor subfamily G member 1, partial [Megalops cyprinoides]|uniref:killer cell lectin-like receptor subfamily G member 1 n=1 Tax=Megalops cyprinoides TaxID=118141 RepID=UPI001863C369
AEDAGKAAEAAGQLSECRAELRATSLLLHRISQDWRCQLCPGGWLWSRGSCYYFSVGLQEDRKWNESAAFCQQHDAHLAVIRDHREMEVIQAQMGTYEPMAFLWVGLTDRLEEGQWVWEDGQPHQDHTLSEVQWNSEERDCADIRGDGSLFASSCEAHGPWVCEKPWNPRKPSSPASLA